MSDSLQPHGLYSPWTSLGQNTEVGSLSLLQGIFPTQGSNLGLLHCRWILYQLSHKRSSRILKWVAYPFSSGSSRPRNWTRVSCIVGGFFTNWAIREPSKHHIHSSCHYSFNKLPTVVLNYLVWNWVWEESSEPQCFNKTTAPKAGTLGEGNGNRLQYSCLENTMEREAWQATVHGVTKRQTQLRDYIQQQQCWQPRAPQLASAGESSVGQTFRCSHNHGW